MNVDSVEQAGDARHVALNLHGVQLALVLLLAL